MDSTLDQLNRDILNAQNALEATTCFHGSDSHLTTIDLRSGIVSGVSVASSLANLGILLEERHRRTGHSEDINEAITQMEQAISNSEESDMSLPGRLSNLSCFLTRRYESERLLDGLERANMLSKEAARIATPDDIGYSRILTQWGINNGMIFEHTGDPAYNDKAIACLEDAVVLAEKARTGVAGILIDLSQRLRSRFLRTQDTRDLNQAIAKAEGALKDAPTGTLLYTTALSCLCNLLGDRYLRLHSDADVRKALELATDVVRLTPVDHPKRQHRLTNLAIRQRDMYSHTGSLDYLDAAIATGHKALSLPLDDYQSAKVSNNLGAFVFERYECTEDLDDLDWAIALAQRSIDATPVNQQDRSNRLMSLGKRLLQRHKRIRSDADRQTALRHLEESANNTTSSPLKRLLGALLAIQCLAEELEWSKANDVASTAMKLLPELCNRSLEMDDQQYALMHMSNLAADACSISLVLQNIEEALFRIEHGRGMILGYLIDERGKPQTQPNVNLPRHNLTHADTKDSPSIGVLPETSGDLPPEASRSNPAEQSLSIDMVQQIAKQGPVIIVNATNISCDAIIITSTATTSLNLPLLSDNTSPFFVSSLQIYREARSGAFSRDIGSEKHTQFETDGLSWLWKGCVKPVLMELGIYDNALCDSQLPRVWWIGTGAASSWPFHAAGEYSFDGHARTESCLDWTIPSSTPTIRALKYARLKQPCPLSQNSSVLVVAMPTTPGETELTGVIAEKNAIELVLKDKITVHCLEHPTADQVLEEMLSADIVHFACHGSSHKTDPTQSHLILQQNSESGPVKDNLTVSDLLKARSDIPARIVYLSACSTAEVKVSYLTDENIHLVSAFQIAGFAHVIGSLQSVDDGTCAKMASLFYSNLLRRRGWFDLDRAVTAALREAVIEVRKEHPFKLGL